MKQRLLVLCLAGAATALIGLQPAQAAMRCGTRLVSEGDHKIEVLSKCGRPAFVELLGYGHYTYWGYRADGGRRLYAAYAQIEEWTYNFGPRRFMRLVRFADGRVVRIVSLDYGY